MNTKKIHIHYVAMLREHIGIPHEEISTTANDTTELYEELATRYKLPWPSRNMRPAVNDIMAGWHFKLHENDRVMFLPPSSGG
jgi:sulfur-carrier protein